MKDNWLELYKACNKELDNKDLTTFVNVGSSACAILTDKGNIYVGKGIESNSKLNTCAEKSAIMNMLNKNEHDIKKMVILNELEEEILPCRDCLNYLLEFDQTGDMDILTSYRNGEAVKLKDILPDDYGVVKIEG